MALAGELTREDAESGGPTLCRTYCSQKFLHLTSAPPGLWALALLYGETHERDTERVHSFFRSFGLFCQRLIQHVVLAKPVGRPVALRCPPWSTGPRGMTST